jgi:hypothetical protein
MRRIVTLLFLFAAATASADTWTFMCYLDADNNGLNGPADINEMEVAGSVTDTLDIIVLWDDGNTSNTAVYHVQCDPAGLDSTMISPQLDDSNYVVPANPGALDMSDPQSLQNFLDWTIARFPADHYALSLWNHGDGIFEEEKPNDIFRGICGGLKLWEISDVLANVEAAIGRNVDIVGFDVCVLGNLETVYQLGPHVDYVIASEANEPGPGWDYWHPLVDLRYNPDMPPEDFASSIVDYYLQSYNGGFQGNTATTQAATSTSLMYSVLMPALDDFAQQLYYTCYNYESEYVSAWNSAEGYNTDCTDLGDFAYYIESNGSLPASVRQSATDLIAALDTAVVAHGHTGSLYARETGVQVWFPRHISSESNRVYYLDPVNYLTFSGGSFWDEWLDMFDVPFIAAPNIDHAPLGDTEIPNVPRDVSCEIVSLAGLIADSSQVFYRVNGSAWSSSPLSYVSGNTWTGTIPGQPLGSTVDYYLSACDTNWHTGTHPLGAPASFHTYHVQTDVQPPVITHTPITVAYNPDGPFPVTATITDNLGLDPTSLDVLYRINDGAEQSVGMSATGNPDEYSADIPGPCAIGDSVHYAIEASDSAAAPNTTRLPATGYYTFIIEDLDYVVWQPSGTGSSGTSIHNALSSLGYSGLLSVDMWDAADLSGVDAVFVCLGIYSNNHVIANGGAEATAIIDYLNSGGRVYLEGGDVWYYDPLYEGGHDFGPTFGVSSSDDGGAMPNPVTGMAGTFTEGMSFTYTGANSWIDELSPTGGGFAILESSDGVDRGIAFDAGTYRTIGTSFELGGLTSGTPLATLVDSIAVFFGMTTTDAPDETPTLLPTVFALYAAYPNPFNPATTFDFDLPHTGRVRLDVFDVLGRRVATLLDDELPAGRHSTVWNASGVASGVYFARLNTDTESATRKVVLLK